ncbi:MAG: peptidase [Pirellulales bacterium]|nr:peptidase [Pirellulales bacterium]
MAPWPRHNRASAARAVRTRIGAVLLAALLVAAAGGLARALTVELVMRDGRILQGSPGFTSGLIEQPQPPGRGVVQSIRFLDDNLRRTFVSKRQVHDEREVPPPGRNETFEIWQRVRTAGTGVASVGPIVAQEPFDPHGRRTLTMMTDRGRLDIVQGITELTPYWAKVEGISLAWDMRIAPSSIPADALDKILNQFPDADGVEHQKKIARFYVRMERYEDALAVLKKLLDAHPDDDKVKAEVGQSLQKLRQASAQRFLDELKYRREAGQHRLVLEKLKAFPSEGVAGTILQEVRELVGEIEAMEKQRAAVVQQLGQLAAKIDDSGTRMQLAPILEEIAAELNANTMPRMAGYRLAADDADLEPANKLALAASGWLLGGNAATPNLSVALSAWRTRGLVRQYLNEPARINAQPILQKLGSEEGAVPKTVALLLANMTPPRPSEEVEGKPGYHELDIPGFDKELPVRYVVQLPPEYDPHRHYPTILALHGAGTTPELAVNWWAGDWDESGWRRGQAGRHGFIVVAPAWTTAHQHKYGYLAREHAAVLGVLRDACRRFAIDTDRVFLSGHSMGGDAAWDIGLAHPDLWAGVIPITARSGRYCAFYWENARNVPFYVVGGERDGRWLADNAIDLDRYLTHGYNATVVEYLGRGHEHFYEEIQRLFDWMKMKTLRRDFFPREFECASMRPWDNFFWWVELGDLPARAMVDPSHWPPPRGTFAMRTESSILATNGVRVRTGAGKVVVWLAPEMVDFDKPIAVTINGRRISPADPALAPNLEVLLEDARTRADRQHPFWAKVELGAGRG